MRLKSLRLGRCDAYRDVLQQADVTREGPQNLSRNARYDGVNSRARHGLTLAVLDVGAVQIVRGKFSYGDLIAFLMLAELFAGPLEQLTETGAMLRTASSAVTRLQDVLRRDTRLELLSQPPADDRRSQARRLPGRSTSRT